MDGTTMAELAEEGYDPGADKFSTSNMALVALLHTKGFMVIDVEVRQSTKFDNKSCFWTFRNRGYKMAEAIKQFSEGRALVEPKQFNSIFRELKAEMYELMQNPT